MTVCQSIYPFIYCLPQLPLLLSPKTNTAAPYWPQEGVIAAHIRYNRQLNILRSQAGAVRRSPISPNMEISGLQLIQSCAGIGLR